MSDTPKVVQFPSMTKAEALAYSNAAGLGILMGVGDVKDEDTRRALVVGISALRTALTQLGEKEWCALVERIRDVMDTECPELTTIRAQVFTTGMSKPEVREGKA